MTMINKLDFINRLKREKKSYYNKLSIPEKIERDLISQLRYGDVKHGVST